MSEAGEARAWAWVAALRAGSTMPWSTWAAGPADPGTRGSGGRFLPGAQQLELLRLVNLATVSTGGPPPDLVERILTASAPGRGRPDLELVGAARATAYGPPPVDPVDLAADELLRVATNLLAEDLTAPGPLPPRPRPLRDRPGRPFRVVGSPWYADAIREELARRGRRAGGRGGTVHVLGADPATMTEQAYVARAFSDGGPGWSDWAPRAASGDHPPPRADLAAMTRTWATRAGREQVRVVLDPTTLPASIGTRGRLPWPATPSADAVELARRTCEPLGLLVLPAEQTELLRRRLLPRVVADAGPPLALGGEALAWAHETGARVRHELADAGYRVVGSTDLLLPDRTRDVRGSGPDDTRVLALAIRLLLEGPARREEEH